eukprot:820378-Pyramimonas_sp.AAC.1
MRSSDHEFTSSDEVGARFHPIRAITSETCSDGLQAADDERQTFSDEDRFYLIHGRQHTYKVCIYVIGCLQYECGWLPCASSMVDVHVQPTEG